MIIMPANNIVFVRIGLFRNAVIKNEDAIIALNRPDIRRDPLSEIDRCLRRPRQKPTDTIMADLPAEQRRQPGCRGLPKRTNQVITVEVKDFIVCHRVECRTLCDSLVRKVSITVNPPPNMACKRRRWRGLKPGAFFMRVMCRHPCHLSKLPAAQVRPSVGRHLNP